MKLENIDYVGCALEDCLVKSNDLRGAAAAFVGGDTFAGYGLAGADGYGGAQGRQSQTTIETGAQANVGRGFAFSQAAAKVKAAAIDSKGFASANYFGLSTFTRFKGSSSSRKFTQHTSYSTGGN